MWKLGDSQQSFFCAIGKLMATKQLGDPSASLLLTSEKAVFCKNTQPPKFLLLTLLQVIYHQLLPVSPYKLKQVFWNAEVAFCIPCKYVSIIDQWRWKQLHGETLPHSAGHFLPGLTGWLLRWRRGEVVVVTLMAVGDVEDVADHGGS